MVIFSPYKVRNINIKVYRKTFLGYLNINVGNRLPIVLYMYVGVNAIRVCLMKTFLTYKTSETNTFESRVN